MNLFQALPKIRIHRAAGKGHILQRRNDLPPVDLLAAAIRASPAADAQPNGRHGQQLFFKTKIDHTKQ